MSTKGKYAEILNLGAILPNIPGQEEVEYVLGSSYQGSNDEEHYILCPFPDVEARHCKILVDKEGDFWINNLDGPAKTFINHEQLRREERRKLNFGDIIWLGRTALAYFEFKERAATEGNGPSPNLYLGEDRGVTVTVAVRPFPPIASDVGGNHVLVQNILKYLSTKELKEVRFVSKSWSSSAAQLLRKRCSLSIRASLRHEQTKLFRCSREMKSFPSTMTSLSVEIPKFSSGPIGENEAEKFLADLVNYQLKSLGQGLTHFALSAWFVPAERVLFFGRILQKVALYCPNLEHLVLSIDFDDSCDGHTMFPADTNTDTDNWSFGPTLKVLEVIEGCVIPEFVLSILGKMDTKKIEKFVSRMDFRSMFLFVMKRGKKKDFRNLKEITLKGSVEEDDLAAIAALPPNILLQKLELGELLGHRPTLSGTLSLILEKFKATLVSLKMTCFECLWGRMNISIVLPVTGFERLEHLHLFYDEDTEVTLPPNFQYAKHLPKLRTLMLDSYKIETGEDAYFAENTKAEALAQWGLNPGVFNAFLPVGQGQVCSSLEELNIPHCQRPPEGMEGDREYEDRLREMRLLFPNVKGEWIKGGT